MPNFGEVTRDFLQFPIYYYDVVYSQSLPVRGYAGAASVLLNGWDPVALAPTLVHTDSSGNLAVSGTISATTSATATAAAPTYVEGSTNPLSMDLNGGIRITGTINASSTVKSTAAAPTYVEGSSNPFSSDLSGGLRVVGAFFQGTQPVSGPVTDTQLRATPVPVSGTVAITNANLDVALSTRTKPSDQQHVIVDSSASVAVTNANLDVALSTRTKPSDQQHVIVDSSAAIAVTGPLTDTQLRAVAVPVSGFVSISGGVVVADSNLDVALSTRTKPSDQQHVIIDSSASIAVTGTFFQTTQPVSLASMPNPSNFDIPISSLVAEQILQNVLAAQQLAILRAGPAGFVPIETPGFFAGLG